MYVSYFNRKRQVENEKELSLEEPKQEAGEEAGAQAKGKEAGAQAKKDTGQKEIEECPQEQTDKLSALFLTTYLLLIRLSGCTLKCLGMILPLIFSEIQGVPAKRAYANLLESHFAEIIGEDIRVMKGDHPSTLYKFGYASKVFFDLLLKTIPPSSTKKGHPPNKWAAPDQILSKALKALIYRKISMWTSLFFEEDSAKFSNLILSYIPKIVRAGPLIWNLLDIRDYGDLVTSEMDSNSSLLHVKRNTRLNVIKPRLKRNVVEDVAVNVVDTDEYLSVTTAMGSPPAWEGYSCRHISNAFLQIYTECTNFIAFRDSHIQNRVPRELRVG